MKVGRGGPPKKALPVVTTAPTVEDAPRLRVGVPGKTYKPEAKSSTLNDAYVEGLANQANRNTDIAQCGLERSGKGLLVCRYGCGGGMTIVDGVAYHAYNCEYWQREGKDKTPF